MARMVRKQVYITEAQERLLKRRARDAGVTEAELIRMGIEQLRRSAPAFGDVASWEAERRYIERRRRHAAPQTGRSWKRDDLYEERIARHTR